MRQTVLLGVLVVILAACGSSNSEQQELPTEFVLPSSTPQPPTDEPTATEVPPTEAAPTIAVPLPTTVESNQPTPTDVNVEQVLEQLVNSGPPFANNNTTTGDSPFQSELPPLDQEEAEWVVVADQPIQVLDCADPGCNVIGTLESGASVEVTTPGLDWHTINFEESTGYVFAEFVQQPPESFNPFEGGRIRCAATIEPPTWGRSKPTANSATTAVRTTARFTVSTCRQWQLPTRDDGCASTNSRVSILADSHTVSITRSTSPVLICGGYFSSTFNV